MSRCDSQPTCAKVNMMRIEVYVNNNMLFPSGQRPLWLLDLICYVERGDGLTKSKKDDGGSRGVVKTFAENGCGSNKISGFYSIYDIICGVPGVLRNRFLEKHVRGLLLYGVLDNHVDGRVDGIA